MNNRYTVNGLALIVTAALGSLPAFAKTAVWDGGGEDDNWNTVANWSAAGKPVANDALQFDGTTRLTPHNDFAAGTNFGNITFNATAGAFTLGGNGIAVGGNINNASTQVQTIGMDLSMAAKRTFTVATDGTLRITGQVSGDGGIAKAGNGLLVLTNDLSLTGATSGGVALEVTAAAVTLAGDNRNMIGNIKLRSSANALLNIASATALGTGSLQVGTSSGGASIDNTSGSALTLTTNTAIITLGNLHFVGTHDLNLGTGAVSRSGSRASQAVTVERNTLTIGGVISDATDANDGSVFSLVKEGAGTLVLSAANIYTGATTINGGTLRVNGSLASTSTVTVNTGGVLGGSGTISGAVDVKAGGTLAAGGGADRTLGAAGLSFASGAQLNAHLTSGIAYDQIDVTGTVKLNGATLNLALDYIPVANSRFFIINNDGVDAVSGIFAGLEQDATVNLVSSVNQQTYSFRISYLGDQAHNSDRDGNDVVLISIPEPATTGVMIISAAVLISRRRRRA